VLDWDFISFIFPISFAQKKEQIGTETVNVVKPYTVPDDSFKPKEILNSMMRKRPKRKD
jgi:hypothetical protein